MKVLYKILILSGLVIGGSASCTDDLNLSPTNSITADIAYKSPADYKQVLAKVYGSFALAGNAGITISDLAGIDPGQADFLRLFWNAQELTTDEAVCVWNDPGIPDFHNLNWTASNVLLSALYNRSLFHVTVCNEFIRESSDEKLSARGISGQDAEEIRKYRAEARFLRAFQYWVLMDLFGNPPFVTENDPIGKYIPPQIKRAELFDYVESELKAVETILTEPKKNEYGRVDKAASWALLSRLYLNAEVYLGKGKGRYNDAITYSDKVIKSGYSLMPEYKHLFLGDNDVNNPEVLLSINYDGIKTQNNGGSTFIINAGINAAMDPPSFGVPNGGWGGNRATKNLPLLFGDYSGAKDKRAMFFGKKIEMEDPAVFTDGLAITKFRNVTRAGVAVPSAGGSFSSVDFPLFRLAEMYLTYAEAVKRGGTGGSEATAVSYINKLRERAYGNATGNVTAITLNDILDERGREFYWEAHRRTDLIRYGLLTSGSYLWPWKGGVKDGRGVDESFNLFPIPATDLIANPNLTQN